MQIRSLGHRTHLHLLRQSGSTVEDRGTHLVVRTPDDPGGSWGNYLLLARPPVPGGEREVVGAFRTEFPLAEHVSVGIDGTEDLTEAAAPFAEAGLEVHSGVVLTTSSLTRPRELPEGHEIRPLESDDDWRQWAELGDALHPDGDRAPHLPLLAQHHEQERKLVSVAPGRRFGAFVEDLLVASVAVFRADDVARLAPVGTHPEHRGRGLAGNLVHVAGSHALTDLGATRLVVVAEPESGAVSLHRALGFVETERQLSMELRPQG